MSRKIDASATDLPLPVGVRSRVVTETGTRQRPFLTAVKPFPAADIPPSEATRTLDLLFGRVFDAALVMLTVLAFLLL